MSNRILSLSMRPKSFSELVEQDKEIETVKKQFKSKRVPHLYILGGPVGSGKTTLARIISLHLQQEDITKDLTEEDWKEYNKYEISEINAANKNGVDDIRQLVSNMRYKPMPPSRAKVVILDEAHQLTNAAQNALITETEDVPDHIYYIFCTSAPNKIIPALKRRAYVITPKALTRRGIKELLEKAQEAADIEKLDISSLTDTLVDNGVTSPGLILQAAERYFAGIPAEESVTFTDEGKIDTMALCRAVSGGSWSSCAKLLSEISKAEVYGLRASVLGYLKAILLKTSGSKSITLSKAINILSATSLEDGCCLASFLANVCLACDAITGSTSASTSVKRTVTGEVKPAAATATTPTAKERPTTPAAAKEQTVAKKTSPVKRVAVAATKTSSAPIAKAAPKIADKSSIFSTTSNKK